jgi:uncharacterized protein
MKKLKFSQYNSLLKITSASSVIYNSKADKCIIIKQEMNDILNFDPEEIEKYNSKLFNDLKSMGALVPISTNELQEVIKQSKEVDNEENEFTLIINPTMNCNFKCWYCYESHILGSQLSTKTLSKVFKLIDSILEQKGDLKNFVLSFFGGEPLMYYQKTSMQIINYLRSKYNEFPNINFSINFTSNGYLVNELILNHLKENTESNHFQITLDGGEEFHNKVRDSGKKEGSYFKILDAIKLLIKNDIQVLLRVNYTCENIDSVMQIVDDIEDIPTKDRENLTIGLFRVWQDDKGADIKDKVNNTKSSFSERGFKIDINETILDNLKNPCYADKKNELLINFNGDVYKCTARDFNQENKYGTLNENGEVEWKDEKLREWENIKIQSKACQSCRILPLCGGGCHQVNLENKGLDTCQMGYNDNDKDNVIMMRLSEYFINEEV